MEWFFGKYGLVKLSELSSVFKAKTVRLVNAVLGRNYKNYSPWMSNLEHLYDLSSLFEIEDRILFDQYSSEKLEQRYLTSDSDKELSLGNMSAQELELLNAALELVQGSSEDVAELFSEVVKHVVPINTARLGHQRKGVGFSTHLAKGSIFLSVPSEKLQLAINIVHELGHQCLYLYQTADQIIAQGLDTPVFSYVRKTHRPAIQAFHATVALAYMVRFLSQVKPHREDQGYCQQALQMLKDDFIRSLDVYDSVVFTELGQVLYDDLKSYAKSA